MLYITGYNPTTYAHMYTQFPSSVELLINCVSVRVCGCVTLKSRILCNMNVP